MDYYTSDCFLFSTTNDLIPVRNDMSPSPHPSPTKGRGYNYNSHTEALAEVSHNLEYPSAQDYDVASYRKLYTTKNNSPLITIFSGSVHFSFLVFFRYIISFIVEFFTFSQTDFNFCKTFCYENF